MPFCKDGEIRRRKLCSEQLSALNIKDKITEDVQEESLEESEDETIYWKDGRRIVDLKVLAEALEKCESCGSLLNLMNIEKERKHGFGSYLFVRCGTCEFINTITTNKTHCSSKGPAIFDINTKAAIGMIEAGLGPRQVNKFITSLGIPSVTEKTLKKREREIQIPLAEVARKSCEDATKEEIEKSRKENTNVDKDIDNETKLTVKYDMCWQKRGSGRSYSSHSGVGSVLGENTGKVLNYSVMSDHCRLCQRAEQMNKTVKDHTCCRNWDKSPKAMEAHTGAELLKTLEDTAGVKVNVLVMDDDSATLSQVRQRLGHPVTKWSDTNHSRKSVGNAMYNTLQKKHKSLTTEVIKYFQKCFSYAIKQNKNDEDSLRSTLNSIVPHAFDHHEKCGTWCKAENENYSHKSLPGEKALQGDELFNDLSIIFATMADNSHKLAPCGSTKEVESLNGIYASKAPKRICYSASESLSNRVAAAVAQKNTGYHYVSEVLVKAGLSPNKITRKYHESLSKERKRHLSYSNLPAVKRRKLVFKKSKKKIQVEQEKREGILYKTDIGLTLTTEVSDIPPIRYRPSTEQVSQLEVKFITFDLETSSLQEDCEILQIASKYQDQTFNCYIQPTKPISKMSSEVTGLTNEGGILFHNGHPIPAVGREAAFQSFVLWLEQFKPVVLLGHNSKLFDSKRLIFNIKHYSCFAEFRQTVKGFVDTLPLAKKLLPGLDNYKQCTLYKHVCGGEFDAHNAVGDVDALSKIVSTLKPDISTLFLHSFTTDSLIEQQQFDVETKKNQMTLEPLVNAKLVSKFISHRLAESGLVMDNLRTVYAQYNKRGIEQLLSDKRNNGGPRVTKNAAVIQKIVQYFQGTQ